jgi:hypothetical protein
MSARVHLRSWSGTLDLEVVFEDLEDDEPT